MRSAQIKHLFKIIGGKPAPKGDNAFSNVGTPFVKMKDLGKAHFSSNLIDIEQKVSDEVAKVEGLNLIRKGSILLPRSGSVALNHRAILGIDSYMVSHICALEVIDNDEINNFFAYYYLRSIKMDSIAKKTTGLDAITFEDLGKLTIPLPAIEDQIRIAHLLGKLEGLIAQRKQHLQQLDNLLKSVFLEMFGDPVRNEKGWEKQEIGRSMQIKHGFAFKSEYFSSEGPYILLTPGNFFEEGGFKNRGEKQNYYTGEAPEEYILNEGSLLLAMTEQAPGLLGSPLIVPASNLYLHNQRLGLVVPKETIQARFLFHLFNQKSIRQIIHSKATGTKVRHTSPTKLEEIIVGYPPIDLQNQFAGIVEKTDRLKEIYQRSLADLKCLYAVLSHKAFKGELDLSRIALTPVNTGTSVGEQTAVEENIPMESSFDLPAPKTIAIFQTADGRKSQIRDWLSNWIEHHGEAPFVAQDFMDAARRRILELTDGETTDWGVPEYDEIKSWVFESLERGRLTQVFDDANNRVHVKTAKR